MDPSADQVVGEVLRYSQQEQLAKVTEWTALDSNKLVEQPDFVIIHDVIKSDDEKAQLLAEFPELKIKFTGRQRNSHSKAAVTRKCINAYIANKYDSPKGLVDLGGNPNFYLKRAYRAHSCCPNLNSYDYQRRVNRKLNAEKMIQKCNDGKVLTHTVQRRVEAMLRVTKSDKPISEEFMCNVKCHKCIAPGRVLVSVDSIYDVTVNDFVESMVSHKSEIGVIAFIEPFALLMGATQGYIPELELSYAMRSQDVSDSGYVQGLREPTKGAQAGFFKRLDQWFSQRPPYKARKEEEFDILEQWKNLFVDMDDKDIVYTFNDGCTYSHSISMLKWSLLPQDFRIHTSLGFVTIHVSKLGRRGGYTILELTMVPGKVPLPKYTAPVVEGQKEYTVVMNWPVLRQGVWFVDPLSMSVPIQVWDPMVAAAQHLPDGVSMGKRDLQVIQKKVQDLRSLASALNSRIVVMGQQITAKDRTRVDFANFLVTATLVYAVEQKERSIKTFQSKLYHRKVSLWEQFTRMIWNRPLPPGIMNGRSKMKCGLYPQKPASEKLSVVVLPPHTPWALPKASVDIPWWTFFSGECMTDHYPPGEFTDESQVVGRFFDKPKISQYAPTKGVVIKVTNGKPALTSLEVISVLGTTENVSVETGVTPADAIVIGSFEDLIKYRDSLKQESAKAESQSTPTAPVDTPTDDNQTVDGYEADTEEKESVLVRDLKIIPRQTPGSATARPFDIGQEITQNMILGPFKMIHHSECPTGAFKDSLRLKNHVGRDGVAPMNSPYAKLLVNTNWTDKEIRAVEEFFTVVVSEYNDSIRASLASFKVFNACSKAEQLQRKEEGEWVSRASIIPDDDVSFVVTKDGVIRKHNTDETLVFLPQRFKPYYEALRVQAMMDLRLTGAKSPKVTPVMGVPGCGKTRMLIDCWQNNVVVITATRATRDQVNTALSKKPAKTADGAMQSKKSTHSIAMVDEAYMLHFGQFLAVMGHLGVKSAVIFGDKQQIPYICRCTLRTEMHGYPEQDEVRQTISHRITDSTATVLLNNYGDIRTTNNRGTKSKVIQITSLEGVPLTTLKKNTAVLTFDKPTKKDILAKRLDPSVVVKTVHEAQGETYTDVILVRTKPNVNFLYLKRDNKLNPHMVVAISRHTQSFTYYTVVQDDLAGFLNVPTNAKVHASLAEADKESREVKNRLTQVLSEKLGGTNTVSPTSSPVEPMASTEHVPAETTAVIEVAAPQSELATDGYATDDTEHAFISDTDSAADLDQDEEQNVAKVKPINLKCGHPVCVGCLTGLVSSGSPCPLCRRPFIYRPILPGPTGRVTWRLWKEFYKIDVLYQGGESPDGHYAGRRLGTLVPKNAPRAKDAIIEAIRTGRFVDLRNSTTNQVYGICIGMHIRYRLPGDAKGVHICDDTYPPIVMAEAADRGVDLTKVYGDDGSLVTAPVSPEVEVYTTPCDTPTEEACCVCMENFTLEEPEPTGEDKVAVATDVPPSAPSEPTEVIPVPIIKHTPQKKHVELVPSAPQWNGSYQEVWVTRESGKFGIDFHVGDRVVVKKTARGLFAGDVVVGVGEAWVEDPELFTELILAAPDEVMLAVWRPALIVQKCKLHDPKISTVVNAANPRISNGGGVTGWIFQNLNGNGELVRELARDYPNGTPTGTAVLTYAHGHPFIERIIHAVGPDARVITDTDQRRVLLERTYRSLVKVAIDNGIRQVAVPSISTGIYGFPKDEAANIAVRALISSCRDEVQIVMCVTDEEMVSKLDEALVAFPIPTTPRVKDILNRMERRAAVDDESEGQEEEPTVQVAKRSVVDKSEKPTAEVEPVLDQRFEPVRDLLAWAKTQTDFCWGEAAIKYVTVWFPKVPLTKEVLQKRTTSEMIIGTRADAREYVEEIVGNYYNLSKLQYEWVKSVDSDALVYTPGHWSFGGDTGERYQMVIVHTKTASLRKMHNYLRDGYYRALPKVDGRLPAKYDEIVGYIDDRTVVDLCPAPGHGPEHLKSRGVDIKLVLHKFEDHTGKSMSLKQGVVPNKTCHSPLQKCTCIRDESDPAKNGGKAPDKIAIFVDVAKDKTSEAHDQYGFNKDVVEPIMDQADKVESLVVIKTFASEELTAKLITMDRPTSVLRLDASSPFGSEVYVLIGKTIPGLKTVPEILGGAVKNFLDGLTIPRVHTGQGIGITVGTLRDDQMPQSTQPIEVASGIYSNLYEYWKAAVPFCTRGIPLDVFLKAPLVHDEALPLLGIGEKFDRGYLTTGVIRAKVKTVGTEGDIGSVLPLVEPGVYSAVVRSAGIKEGVMAHTGTTVVGLSDTIVDTFIEPVDTNMIPKDDIKLPVECLRRVAKALVFPDARAVMLGTMDQMGSFARIVTVFVQRGYNVGDLCAIAYKHSINYLPHVVSYVGRMVSTDVIDEFKREVNDATPYSSPLSKAHVCKGLCIRSAFDAEKFFRTESMLQLVWSKPKRVCCDYVHTTPEVMRGLKLEVKHRGSRLADVYKPSVYASTSVPLGGVCVTNVPNTPVSQLSDHKKVLADKITQFNLDITTQSDGFSPYYTYPEAKLSQKDDLRQVSPMTAVEVVRIFVNDITPGNGVIDNRWDADQLELGDMDIATTHAAVKESRLIVAPKFAEKVEPVIRTGVQAPYANTFKSMISGVNKRNANPPVMTNGIAPEDKAVIMEHAFIKHILVDGAERDMERFRREPLGVTVDGLRKWLQKLDGDSKVRQLLALAESGVSTIRLRLEHNPMDTYELSLKTNPKTMVTTSHQSQMQKPQVILASEPMVTAIVSNVVQSLQKRIETLLRPCVITPWSRNSTNLDAAINYHLSSLESQDVRLTEIDLSAFDKSQLESAHLLKMYLYQDFGMHPTILKMWDAAHRWTINRHFNTGSSFKFLYQHKSGDATTLLGNTLVNLAIYAAAYDAPPEFMAAVGDDSIFSTKSETPIDYVERQYAELGNLEAKKVTNVSAYFCGSFIVRDTITGQFALVKDPVKVAYRLGSSSARSEDQLAERFISLQDEINTWKRPGVRVPLGYMAAERYNCTINVGILMEALLTISRNWETYRAMWIVPKSFYPKNWQRYLSRLEKTGAGTLVAKFLRKFVITSFYNDV